MTEPTDREEPMTGLTLSIETYIDAATEKKVFRVRCLIGNYAFSICDPRDDRLEAVSLRRTFEEALRGVVAAEVKAFRQRPAAPAQAVPDEHWATLSALRECCEVWEPEVCVMGNVRAGDAAAAIQAMLAAPPSVGMSDAAQEPVARLAGVPTDIIKYTKGVYDFLESVAPAGIAIEAFRLPPSPTRAQREIFDAATSDPDGEHLGLARQNQSDRREDRHPVATRPQPAQAAVSGVDAQWVEKADTLAMDVARAYASRYTYETRGWWQVEGESRTLAAREALRTHLSTAVTAQPAQASAPQSDELGAALDNLVAAVKFYDTMRDAVAAGEDVTRTGIARDANEWLRDAAHTVAAARQKGE
jgi:hypothetical protein